MRCEDLDDEIEAEEDEEAIGTGGSGPVGGIPIASKLLFCLSWEGGRGAERDESRRGGLIRLDGKADGGAEEDEGEESMLRAVRALMPISTLRLDALRGLGPLGLRDGGNG